MPRSRLRRLIRAAPRRMPRGVWTVPDHRPSQSASGGHGPATQRAGAALLPMHCVASRVRQAYLDSQDSSKSFVRDICRSPVYCEELRPLLKRYIDEGKSHPKLDKVEEIVAAHFHAPPRPGSRILVFSQYRASVEEIATRLARHAPRVKAMTFVGQADSASVKGLNQKACAAPLTTVVPALNALVLMNSHPPPPLS